MLFQFFYFYNFLDSDAFIILFLFYSPPHLITATINLKIKKLWPEKYTFDLTYVLYIAHGMPAHVIPRNEKMFL